MEKNPFKPRYFRDFLWVLRQNPVALRKMYEEQIAQKLQEYHLNQAQERMYADPYLRSIIRKGLYR